MTIDEIYRLATFRGFRNLNAERERAFKRLEGVDFGEDFHLSASATVPRGIWVRVDLGLVFQTLLKSGSTSMTHLFRQIQRPKNPIRLRAKPLYGLSRKSAVKVKSFKRFTQARNPYSRVLSAFVEKNPRPEFAHFPGMGDLSPHGFATFIKFLRHGGLHEDKHWMPMVDQLSWPVRSFDYIFHLENLQSDFQHMLETEKLTLPRRANTSKPHWVDKYRPGKITRSGLLLREFYSPSIEEIVDELYENDFGAFSYPFGLKNVPGAGMSL